ncbi:carbohydrate kinase family protein [Halorubrum lipolyticum]|uniref:PfkB domain protein n=1 Tax=Halorubrum lipolyticum DSM 21995 TaxID=1227482 RepID=M0NNX8_9EURY|nr:PfkB family carbohydrate kinase [Halorubrum lipolyticum]EMA59328.1 PfkB domain protein [Halorubrum lipolyticum DSM 21995]
MTDILVAGETLVDLLPGEGETLRDVDGFTHRPGGAPANVAVGLSRLGTPPAFWTRLGDDPFGDFLREALDEEGVPDALSRRVGGNTTLAVVSPPGVDGRRFRFYGSRDVTFGFEPDAVPVDALASASWVHVGGVALTHPTGRAAMRKLAAAADERGCTVSFDVNYRPDLVPEGERDAVVEAIRDILGDTDVAFASDEDVAATGISSHEGEELARDLLELGPHTAVVTLGSAGAVAASMDAAPWGETTARHGGFAVEAVDATGAGDAFTSGLIRRLASETGDATGSGDASDLGDALAFANATAALSVQDRGGMTALPDREAVEAFLAERA